MILLGLILLLIFFLSLCMPSKKQPSNHKYVSNHHEETHIHIDHSFNHEEDHIHYETISKAERAKKTSTNSGTDYTDPYDFRK